MAKPNQSNSTSIILFKAINKAIKAINKAITVIPSKHSKHSTHKVLD